MGVSMNINIYYGGRGLIEDPTIQVLNQIQTVLEELRVHVQRFNLFADKNNLSTLPATLKEADGIILAVTVEWIGIGGLMNQFLDNCWLYGDKNKISSIYMMPVVMATTSGERDAEIMLVKAWEALGGIPFSGVTAYVESNIDFETNKEYTHIIEKSAEAFYRTVNQKPKALPKSSNAIKKTVSKTRTADLTPQESEQLSRFVSDDTYVRKQKEDIEELTVMFKQMLGEKGETVKSPFITALEDHFDPTTGLKGSYSFAITDKKQYIYVSVDGGKLSCTHEEKQVADIFVKITYDVFHKIMAGHMTFQRAFMSGELIAKGDFQIFRALDQIFRF